MDGDVDSAEELLRNADVAMYTAKNAGKQRHEVFEPAMHAAVLRRHRLKEDLQRAAERGELVVELQPIVELATATWPPPRRSCAGTTPSAGA